MDGITVVVANGTEAPPAIHEVTAALMSELVDGEDEVVWVDRAGIEPELDGVTYLRASPGEGRGGLYGLGLRHGTRDVVAFTDSTTVLQPGWRRAVVAAFRRGAVVAGGPVLPSPWSRCRDWAGFFAEYGLHAVDPYTNAAGDLSANNIAYARPLLADLEGPVWKSEVNRRLMSRGIRPMLIPDMRVVVVKSYSWEWMFRERIRQGGLYARHRSGGWSPLRRLGYAAATPLLPVVLFSRVAARAGSDPELLRRLRRCAPAVSLAMTTWSVGEALGALGWKDRHAEPF